jgi:hypothetical protein
MKHGKQDIYRIESKTISKNNLEMALLNQSTSNMVNTVISGPQGVNPTIGHGATGHGVTGHGVTGMYYMPINSQMSNGYSNVSNMDVIRAGHDHQKEECQKDIMNRFYDKLYKIFESESENKQNTKKFFELSTQIGKNPGLYLEPDEYYKHGLTLFYILLHSDFELNENKLWLRSKSNIYEIKLTTTSGSIYQSPYDYHNGMIYLGVSESEGHCFCSEQDKSITFMSPYYFSRTPLLHHVSNSIMKTVLNNLSQKPIFTEIGNLILQGKLSDDEIECQDGVVKISKSILSSHSSYFLYLFTNDTFKKQESYKLDFTKKVLEYYILYCCKTNREFDINIVHDMIHFADYIQDRKFLESYYSEIYKHRDTFSSKSLIEIMKIYRDLGF